MKPIVNENTKWFNECKLSYCYGCNSMTKSIDEGTNCRCAECGSVK